MMAAYIPFLLPLLREYAEPDGFPEVSSPLEEEAVYNRLPRCGRPDWDQVAALVQRKYGIRFLFHLEKDVEIQSESAGAMRPSPGRFLLIRDGTRTWFLMEHPCALEAFDRLGADDQQPALGRPSLFVKCMAAIPQSSGWRAPEGPERVESDSSQAAFLHHLQEITDCGEPSDWHLEPTTRGFRSRLRIHGKLTPAEELTESKGRWLVNSVINQAGLDKSAPGKALDGRFALNTPRHGLLNVRVSLVPSLHGYALAARFLYTSDNRPRSLEDLGVPPSWIGDLASLFREKDGLWLLAGPTGSGKSTTLHSLLGWSVEQQEKVLAVEDPVERIVPGVQHLQVDETSGLTFDRAVRAFLRQAPDCLLVGEIRDRETAAIALQAARTGHRVLSSIHARDTTGVLRRFADLDQAPEQVIPVCRLLVHQRLLPLLCPNCRRETPLPDEARRLLRALGRPLPAAIYQSGACPSCNGGVARRTGLFALRRMDEEIADRERFLDAAWGYFLDGKTPLRCLMPFFTKRLRRDLKLCQL